MRCKAGYAGQATGAAKSALIFQAIYAAASGADLAGLQAGKGSLGAILKHLLGHLVVAGQGKSLPVNFYESLFCHFLAKYFFPNPLCILVFERIDIFRAPSSS